MDTTLRSDNSITRRSSARLKPKPFSDVTNTHSPLPKPKSKPVPESEPQPALSSTRNHDDGDDGGNPNRPTTPKSKDQEPPTSAGENNENNVELRTARVGAEIHRARRKGKEKVLDTTPALSCPPMRWGERSEKIVSLENRVAGLLEALSVPHVKKETVQLENHVIGLHEAFSVPLVKKEKRKRQCWTTGKSQKPRDVVKKKLVLPRDVVKKKLVLPRDFVKEQKAYFTEIDAFELPEEEVSYGDLE